MRALRTFGPDDTRTVEEPIPEPGPRDVLIRIEAVGVCHTDVEILTGRHPDYASGRAAYPIILGHEWSGEIVEFGAEVGGLAVGESVVGETAIGCMSCQFCKAGCYHLCPFGSETGVINRDGAMREYHAAPAFSIHKHSLAHDDACLIEPATVAVYAVNRGRLKPGRRALVIGDGVIGLFCVQAAKAAGAGSVTLVGHHDMALEIGRQLGADITINSRSTDQAEALAEADLLSRPEVVIEAAGSAGALDMALTTVARSGAVVVVGYSESAAYPHSLAPIIGSEVEVLGVRGSPNCWPETIRLIENGTLGTEPLVGPRFGLEDFAEAVAVARSGESRQCRTIIQPES